MKFVLMIIKFVIIVLLFVFFGIVNEEKMIFVGVLGMFNINISKELIMDILGMLLLVYFIYSV